MTKTIRQIERDYGTHRLALPLTLLVLLLSVSAAWSRGESWLWVALCGLLFLSEAAGLWLCRYEIRQYDAEQEMLRRLGVER